MSIEKSEGFSTLIPITFSGNLVEDRMRSAWPPYRYPAKDKARDCLRLAQPIGPRSQRKACPANFCPHTDPEYAQMTL